MVGGTVRVLLYRALGSGYTIFLPTELPLPYLVTAALPLGFLQRGDSWANTRYRLTTAIRLSRDVMRSRRGPLAYSAWE